MYPRSPAESVSIVRGLLGMELRPPGLRRSGNPRSAFRAHPAALLRRTIRCRRFGGLPGTRRTAAPLRFPDQAPATEQSGEFALEALDLAKDFGGALDGVRGWDHVDVRKL